VVPDGRLLASALRDAMGLPAPLVSRPAG
jgi:hypothetical protein